MDNRRTQPIGIELVKRGIVGEGEYRVMNHSGNGFQEPDNMLALRLKEVLNSNLSNHIICLPYAYVSVKHMTADARGFWYPFCGS